MYGTGGLTLWAPSMLQIHVSLYPGASYFKRRIWIAIHKTAMEGRDRRQHLKTPHKPPPYWQWNKCFSTSMQYFNLLLFQSNSIPCPIQEITEIVTFQWGDLGHASNFWAIWVWVILRGLTAGVGTQRTVLCMLESGNWWSTESQHPKLQRNACLCYNKSYMVCFKKAHRKKGQIWHNYLRNAGIYLLQFLPTHLFKCHSQFCYRRSSTISPFLYFCDGHWSFLNKKSVIVLNVRCFIPRVLSSHCLLQTWNKDLSRISPV